MRKLVLLAMAGTLAATGCGPGHGRVHGRIRYQGQEVTRATIIFLADDNRSFPVPIQPDGSYAIASLPHGHIRVGIQADLPRVPPRPPPGSREDDAFAAAQVKTDDAAKGVRRLPSGSSKGSLLPERYRDPRESGLAFDLDSPDREYSLELP
jgi:hypothetical protein